MRKKEFKVIDLFAGVGGLSYGFEHDNEFKVVAANEILKPMATAYSLNNPEVKMYNRDIKDLSFSDLESDLGLKKGDIDVIVGGPPCQAYSTVGKRLIDDPRGKLFQEYFRILKEIMPKIFVFENVKGMLSMMHGELIETVVSLFESIGYNVQYKVLNAADYGAPQIRERVIIVGTLGKGRFVYPEPTHTGDRGEGLFSANLKPWVTLGEALGDLPSMKAGEEKNQYACAPQNEYQALMRKNASDTIAEHNTSKNGAHIVRIMEALPDGGAPEDLPEDIRPTSGFKNTYCRLWWDKPSTTITRNLGTPSSSRCIHPRDPRPLSTREGARLQGFPDDYIFYGTKGEKNLQIGNAVPTFLSKAIKESVKEFLNKNIK